MQAKNITLRSEDIALLEQMKNHLGMSHSESVRRAISHYATLRGVSAPEPPRATSRAAKRKGGS